MCSPRLATGSYEPRRDPPRAAAFPRERVVELLRQAGLECIAVNGVLDDGTLVEPADEPRQLKVLYIARHAKGGAAQ